MARRPHLRSGCIEHLEPRMMLASAVLDVGTTYQTIQGYGTHMNADSSLTDVNLRNAYRDAGFNMVRLEVGPQLYTYNKSGDLSVPIPIEADYAANIVRFDFERGGWAYLDDFIKWARQNAMEPERFKLSGAVWSPPHWLKIGTGTLINWTNWDGTPRSDYGPFFPYGVTGGNTGGGRVDPARYQELARWILSFIKGYGDFVGVPIDSFSFQNEPDYEGFYNTCSYGRVAKNINDLTQGYTTNWNLYADAFGYIVQELAAHPEITTKMIGPEIMTVAPWANGNSDAVRQGLVNQSLLDDMDIIGAHGYEGINDSATGWNTFWNRYDQDGKPIYMTESSGESQNWMDSATSVGNGALALGLKIHNAFTYGHSSTYEYWSFSNSTVGSSLVQPANRANPTADYKYDAVIHFSRFIRPGTQRIKATFENGQSAIGGSGWLGSANSLNISSYYHAVDRRLSTVLVNMKSTADTTTITLPASLNIAGLAAYRTSGTEKFVRLADMPVVNGQVTLTVPAYSMVTLDGSVATSSEQPPAIVTPANASPQTVTGTQTVLSVTATDDGGPVNLTYTWSVLGTPPAAVTYSVNGTSGASATTVTFAQPGTYDFRVAIRDIVGNSVASDVRVTAVSAGANVTLAPATARLGLRDTVQFSATATDQFGQAMPVTWSLASGGGSISPSGLYTPSSPGTAVVEAACGTASQTASVTVLAVRNVQEAEQASYGGGAGTESSNGNFNGTSYINFPGNGGYLQFSSTDGGTGGTSLLDVRYALGSTTARTGRLVVNGVPQGITFAPTGAWSTWALHRVAVTLTAGRTNTIRLESTGSDLANVDEIYLVDPAPSAVTLQVNDGAVQRSAVGSLTVQFDRSVSPAAGAFALSRRGGSASISTSISSLPGDGRTYVLSFSDTSVVGGSLPDGIYDLVVTAAAVQDAYGQTLTGGNRTFTFHRLFGDTNGDKTVNLTDYRRMRITLGRSDADPLFNGVLDHERNGIVNILDLTQFRRRFGARYVY